MARDWQLTGKKALVPGENEVVQAIRAALEAEGAEVSTGPDGNIDIIINAAADIRDPSSTTLDSDSNSWAADMERCFEGPRRLTHDVLPGMIESGFGRIVNVIGSFEPMHFNSEFAAWGAMAAWSKSLTREVGKHGITINAIQPSVIDCAATRSQWSNEDLETYITKRIPSGRMCTPEDIASLTVYLCSPFARYVTGTIIPVDGGMGRHQR
ncbi:MAG TPA: 3-oxoacyl-ACP reductase [Rhodospirillaceae bacterium]|nr:3-oxoacyl-ACP reductase [Rhodospirillaceae bacterium]HAA91915.1 3-oxoacyl-ACP reductase [Rhodospirillaceae bacterium]HAT36014.1 3-oxoacyl-ACP reductase [Rhodospirillaceae bacterium]